MGRYLLCRGSGVAHFVSLAQFPVGHLPRYVLMFLSCWVYVAAIHSCLERQPSWM